jgi:hypothetical protein
VWGVDMPSHRDSPLLPVRQAAVYVSGVARERLVCLLGPSPYNSEAKFVRLADTELVLLSPVLPVDRHRRCLTKPLARATSCASAMGPRVLLSG